MHVPGTLERQVCAVDQKQDWLVGKNKKTIGKAQIFFFSTGLF